MGSVSKRINNRRRLAALTFLSNISLDGTHRDTKLSELNFNLKCNKSSTSGRSYVAKGDKLNHINVKQGIESNVCKEDNDSTDPKPWVDEKKFKRRDSDFKRRNSEYCDQENIDRFYDQIQTRNKDRVHKFVSEAKARLCNLSQKRKLSQKSIESYSLPSGHSTESLIPGTCRSRKASICPSEISYPSAAEVKLIKSLKECRNQSERVVLVSSKKSPFMLFSILPYNLHSSSKNVNQSVFKRGESKLEGSRRRHTSMRQLVMINDGPDPMDLLFMMGVEKPLEGQDISYGELLAPSNITKKRGECFLEPLSIFCLPYHIPSNSCISELNSIRTNQKSCAFSKEQEKNPEKEEKKLSHSIQGSCANYHPNLLDDPELIAGKHRTLLVFPSYVTSVIDYVKPSDLKKDLNDKFREKFPQVKLTLSKLRSLKREMHKIAKHECNIDTSVVAQAFVYFEKLILKVLVNKQNRKHCAGACLLLSAKLNDVRGLDLRMLLEKIETVFRINRKDLMCLEFGILVALEFSLLLSSSEILPHYQRLIYES